MTRNVETDPRRSRLVKWILRVLVAIVLCTMMAVVNYIWLKNEFDNPLPFIGFDFFLVIAFIHTVWGKKPLKDIVKVSTQVAPFWLRPKAKPKKHSRSHSRNRENPAVVDLRRDQEFQSPSGARFEKGTSSEPPCDTGSSPTQGQ